MQELGTILVTGDAGYICSHTVRPLLAAACELVAFDMPELGGPDTVLIPEFDLLDCLGAAHVDGVAG